MKTVNMIAAILLIIGGLNWGLVGAIDFDLVAFLFGKVAVVGRIVYILVGLAAVWAIFQWKSVFHCCCEKCDKVEPPRVS